MLTGVVIFSSQKLTALSVSPIMLSNLAFPCRNVLIKLDQRNQVAKAGGESTELRFLSLHAAALPFTLSMACAKFLWIGVRVRAVPHMVFNALLFNSYHFASIAILEQLDALTHSLANTMKRFTGILLSFVVLGETVTSRHELGLLCTAVGFPMYVFGKGNFVSTTRLPTLRSKSARNWLSMLPMLVLGILIGAMLGNSSPSSMEYVINSLVNSRSATLSSLSARDYVPPESAK